MTKLAQIVCLLAASIVSCSAAACSSPVADGPIVAKQFFPYAERSTGHWPSAYTTPIGGLVSFLAPKGTVLQLKALFKGMSDALTPINERQVAIATAKQRQRFVDGDQPVDFSPQKYQWIHVFAQSFGKSEALLTGPRGWKHRMEIGVVYPSAEESIGRLPVAATLSSDGAPILSVDAYDNILLSVPGEVADQWELIDGAAGIGFKLTRIEMQEVPYKDAPRVRLFLSSNRSPQIDIATIKRASRTGEVVQFQFRIEARPTPVC